MGIRFVSHKTYESIHMGSLDDQIHELAEREMIKANEIEKAIAIKRGNVTKDGIPWVTVIIDGAWSKRSYKGGRYDALSGL